MKNQLIILLSIVALFLTGCDDGPTTNDDIPYSPSFSVIMKRISAQDSTFQMGMDAEISGHAVSFTHDFYMDSTEVTQGEYDKLMAQTYQNYRAPSWDTTYGVGDNHPVYNINWFDAVLYANARSNKDNRDSVYTYTEILGTPGNDCELTDIVVNFSKNGYRLPTEAEWEYAYRGSTTTEYYYWGTNMTDLYAWYSSISNLKSQTVALKLPNNYDLYDMGGNVWEWCHDSYGPLSSDPQIDPTGGITDNSRVIRGGSFTQNISLLRTILRNNAGSLFEYHDIGFRVVCVD